MLPLSVKAAEQLPVKIKVKTDIRNGKEKETYELTTFGRYYKKGNTFYLQYEEVMEEQGTIKTIVKMSDADSLILRSGGIKMRLPFLMNKSLRGSYETPYGVLEMVTLTKRLEHFYNEEKGYGSFDILYELNMQGSKAGTYHMTIIFEEDGQ